MGIFHGFCYITYSGLAGVGDWKELIAFWPHQTFLRVLEVVFGTLICTGVVRFFAALFSTFPESLTRLALVPYASATFIFCLAGLRIPHGRYPMLISVLPASLMGQVILLCVAPSLAGFAKNQHPKKSFPPVLPLFSLHPCS